MNSCRFRVASETVRTAITEYLVAYKALYGPQKMQPKFHKLLHFIFELTAFGSLPNCFVLERKHRVAKRFASSNTATNRNYSAACLREVTAHHLANLQRDESVHFVEDACLIEPKQPAKKLLRQLHVESGCTPTFMVSQTARVNKWEKVAVGDMVLCDIGSRAQVGQVLLLASAADAMEVGLFAAIKPFDIVESRDRDWSVRCSGTSLLILMTEIKHALIHCDCGGGELVVLKPWSQR